MRSFHLPIELALMAALSFSAGTPTQDSQPASAPTTRAADRPAPTQEPKALATFNKMVDAIYRPRASGLKDIKCKFTIDTRSTEGEAKSLGPFRLEWAVDKVRIVDDATGSPPQMRFGVDLVFDLVGYDPLPEALRCNLTMKSATELMMQIPLAVKDRPYDFRIFTLDRFNRPVTDEIYKADGSIFMTTAFGYDVDPDSKPPFVVMSRSRTQAQGEVVAIYEYTKHADFMLVAKAITKLPNGNISICSYSAYEVNTGLEIK